MQIQYLPKEEWQGHIVPIGYTATEIYEVTVARSGDDFTVTLQKKPLAQPVVHAPEQFDFPDRLYAEHWEGACAYGIVQDGDLAAVIETCPEEWSNRLRVTELWVAPACQKRGVGHALMELAKQRAVREKRRALILETQSCNVNAVEFYLHEGFTLIGFDACCYSNNDLARGEVRLEMGYLL